MKNRIIGLVLLGICALSSYAQNKTFNVSGKVIESDTQQPIELAGVQLLSLPDSTIAAAVATQKAGLFSLQRAKAGKYVLKITYIGFNTKFISLSLSSSRDLGTIALKPDAVLLKEAVVTAQAPPVTAVADTLMYNSTAFRTPQGAMLEELVKKLPGAEVSDDGTVKINGKEVKKLLVDGKEFFGGDVKTGLKNLPVNMVDKVKTYDKKSDLARVTGIDDGEEETVLDLKVKKGMNEGWFGNLDVAAGNKSRYSTNLMLNRFDDGSQISVIGGGNNVNDRGFSGGGGGPRWMQPQGLNATKTAGINFATETSKLETGGSVRYNYADADLNNVSSAERFLQSGNSFSNTNAKNRNKSHSFNADFRLEWKPDTLTNIIFRPNISYSKADNRSTAYTGTFNSDPYNVVTNPNDYLNFGDITTEDPLKSIRVNATNTGSKAKNDNISFSSILQLNRRLNSRGRNITFRGSYDYSNQHNDQYAKSETRYYQLLNVLGGDSILYRNQYINTPTKNYNYSAQLTYSEPIAKSTFLQFSYRFTYSHSRSDKSTYDLLGYPDWDIYGPLPNGYEQNRVDSLSKNAQYSYYNHNFTTSLRFIYPKYQLSVGISMQPQHSKMSYYRSDMAIDTTRNVFNFAPNIDFRYKFSKVSQLRITYRGRSSEPGMDNLLPITDNSNPLSIRIGNPGLKPSFSHSIRMFYNNYIPEKQRSMMAHLFFNATQNAVSNSTEYNEKTGGTITRPENIDGNWNAFGMFMLNTALKDQRFSISTFSRASFTNNVAFLFDNTSRDNLKNTTTELALGENLSATYRNNWFDVSLNSSINYSIEHNKLQPDNNQKPYTFVYGASTNITLPWQMSLSTNVANNMRRGYRDASMNRNEWVWNAQIAQSFLKGAATVSFEMNDILRQQSSITRALTAYTRSVTEYNAINSYFLVHFIYKLNIFGSKQAQERMEQKYGPMPPMGRPGGMPPGHPGMRRDRD